MTDTAEQAALLEKMLATPKRYIERIGGERYGRLVAELRMKVDPPAFCQYPGCGAALLYSCAGCVPKLPDPTGSDKDAKWQP